MSARWSLSIQRRMPALSDPLQKRFFGIFLTSGCLSALPSPERGEPLKSVLKEKLMMKIHAAAAAVSTLSGVFMGGMGFSAASSPIDPMPTPGSYCAKTGTTASVLGNLMGATAPCDSAQDACEQACTNIGAGQGSYDVTSIGEDKCIQSGAPECSNVNCTQRVYLQQNCVNFRFSKTLVKEACL